jgi:glutamate racemase
MLGFFDSGSGGLSVVKAFRERGISEEILYFGDFDNAPYGNKNPQQIEEYIKRGLSFLKENGADKIVSACNSASVLFTEKLLEELSFSPFSYIEMTYPTIKHFPFLENGSLLILATKATINSGVYQKGLLEKKKVAQISSLIVPNLVFLIENGRKEKEIYVYIKKILSHIENENYTHILLGCTHFPLVKETFRRVLDEKGKQKVEIIDPAFFVAEEAFLKWGNKKENGKMRLLHKRKSAVFNFYFKSIEKAPFLDVKNETEKHSFLGEKEEVYKSSLF